MAVFNCISDRVRKVASQSGPKRLITLTTTGVWHGPGHSQASSRHRNCVAENKRVQVDIAKSQEIVIALKKNGEPN